MSKLLIYIELPPSFKMELTFFIIEDPLKLD